MLDSRAGGAPNNESSSFQFSLLGRKSLMPPLQCARHTLLIGCAFLMVPSTGYGVGQSYTGGTYSENFNLLSSVTSVNASQTRPFADYNATFPGWALRFAGSRSSSENEDRDTGSNTSQTWVPANNYLVNNGVAGSPSFYSYGVDNSSERALGVFENNPGGNTGGDRAIILIMVNDTAKILTSYTLAYDGEQWRGTLGGIDSLIFDYTITAVNQVITEGNNQIGWTEVAALNFTSPQYSATLQSSQNLDGNAAANRRHLSATVPGISWQPGQWLTMRWWSNNAIGADQGLAIDNLTFSATPEPNTLLSAVWGLLILHRKRRLR